MDKYEYQVGGSLKMNSPTYVERQADYELYQGLFRGEFCYVFSSRQMGKSSLRTRTRHRLEKAGYVCASIDMTRIGSNNITPNQWYKGIIVDLLRGFNLYGKFNLTAWWQEKEALAPLQRLSYFIEDVLLVQVQGQIFIFVDEIDSVLGLDFPTEDFFALIRYCYNQRAENPAYSRLTWALFGVATPTDLIGNCQRTPFNIGKSINLSGFKLAEIAPLAAGLEGKVDNPLAVLKEILAWTNGQPFLTQKLCQIVIQQRSSGSRASNGEAVEERYKLDTHLPIVNYHLIGFYHQFSPLVLEKLVRSHILENWEAKDEPEHLQTVRDRILRNEHRAGALLKLLQQLLQKVEVITDGSTEHIELLLSGLVIELNGRLQVKNRIYAEVFSLAWVEKQLTTLRPYAQALQKWGLTKDPAHLLQGEELNQAQTWAEDKSLSDLDYQFLLQSQQSDRAQVETKLKKVVKLQKFLLVAVNLILLALAAIIFLQ